jgi:hypothetical protein
MTTQYDPDQPRDGNGKWLLTLTGAERRAEAARLRSRGYTYRQIATALNTDVRNAYDYVREAMQAVVREAAEDAIAFELDRLDQAHRKALAVLEREHITVSNGRVVELDGQPLPDDGPILSAIDRIVKISESRRKLLGLDQPAKTQISGGVSYEIVGINPEELR